VQQTKAWRSVRSIMRSFFERRREFA
jgi:hypothetical protein